MLFFDQTDLTAGIVTAIGGVLPAAITATSLKIWLESRRNLDRSSDQMSLLFKQRIRMLLFWSRGAEVKSEADFQDHIRSCNLYLAYLRAGGDDISLELKPETTALRSPKEARPPRSSRKPAGKNGGKPIISFAAPGGGS